MLIVVICETFGWTYDEYLDQPKFFIDLIKTKMRIDAQRTENEVKNLNKK